MNRFDIIAKIGDNYHVGNTETGEFSYVQAFKSIGDELKKYQKGKIGKKHQYIDIRFENERLVILVECKNKFSNDINKQKEYRTYIITKMLENEL